MRIESSVTSVSWIPSEAVTGLLKGTFEAGFTHYDDPPPDVIDDLEELRARRARSASPTTSRRGSRSRTGRSSTPATRAAASWASTTVRLAKLRATFEPVPLPDIRHEPEIAGHRGRASCRPPAAAPASRRRGA